MESDQIQPVKKVQFRRFQVTKQTLAARKITVTRAMIKKAVLCNRTWGELSVAIQTHLRIQIQPDVRPKGDSQWQRA